MTDIHAAGRRADGAQWTLCGRLVMGPPDWLGSVSSADVRVHAGGGEVMCPACLRALKRGGSMSVDWTDPRRGGAD